MATITLEGSSLVYRSRYDSGLVSALKATIPDTDRRWDKARNAWIVAPTYGAVLAAITQQYLGETVAAPGTSKVQTHSEQRLLDVRYIGTCKDRGANESTAYGWANGSWSVVFAEKVLRAWFEMEQQPDVSLNLYGVLTVAKTANPDVIKKAYRRLSLQWHPDRCREPNAKETFQRINAAYQILSDPTKRAKYDAGLALEASLKSSRDRRQTLPRTDGYRSPLRCGYILATGHDSLGRFVVEKIEMWEDVVRGDGKTLVTSWPMGAETFTEAWV